MSRSLALGVSSLVFAFSLGCSMGDSVPEIGATTTPATVEAPSSETCCCEYKEEGAVAPTYSEMAKSNCESWGYACVDEGKCEAAEDGEDAEAEDAEVEDAEVEEAEGEEAEEAEEAAPAPAPRPRPRPTSATMTRSGSSGGATTRGGSKGTTTKSGSSSRSGSSGSSSGSGTMKR